MGEIHCHSEMDGLQRDSDQRPLENVGDNSLGISHRRSIFSLHFNDSGRRGWTSFSCRDLGHHFIDFDSFFANSHCVFLPYGTVRKRELSQIQQVSVLVKAKLENRVAMTMALVTVALVISFIPMTVVFILGDYFQVFRGLLAWRVVETLVYLNSIASPLIYCYRDRLFRTAVLEILRIRKPKAKQVPVCNAVPFVRRNDSSGSVKDVVQIRNVENPVILTRPASCDLAMLSVERGHLPPCFHKTRLKRSASAPSLKKDSFCYD